MSSQYEFNPTMERIAEIISNKVQNPDKSIFRLMVSYNFCKLASMMRAKINLEGAGHLPINMYCINLAISGSGKGHSLNILEEQVTSLFRNKFLTETLVLRADANISQLAVRRAKKSLNPDPDAERESLLEEFRSQGPLLFSFDSATEAAIKQMRHQLLMASCGAMNLEIDEIGSNLLGNMDAINTYLELFDIGKIKQKLVKHTKDNKRAEELFGSTPTNMLLFGTPSKLLDGAKVEESFYEMLTIGYARRCFFGYHRKRDKSKIYTAEEIYDIITDTNADAYLLKIATDLQKLALVNNVDQVLNFPKPVTLELLNYRLECQRKADLLSEYDEVRSAELKHRYFKVAKLAGAYAWIENTKHVTADHLHQAIALAEQSGQALNEILNRDRPWVKLCSFICTIGRPVTHADLVEDLPFYKGTASQKTDLMTLAVAHGYQNNQIITRIVHDGIEFFSGKSLVQTDLNELILSYSRGNYTTGYTSVVGKWVNLYKVCTTEDVHWCNHGLVEHYDHPGEGGYRDDNFIIPGFNLVVLDVEDSVTYQMAEMLLKDFTYFIHTTKRHTDKNHRFRIVMPLSHILEMDLKDYKAFMDNIYNWLPFDVDTATSQRSRKWSAHVNPDYQNYNEGELLDAYQFIPKTRKAEEIRKQQIAFSSLSNLERWFLTRIGEGNRNNMLARYGFALVDAGQDLDSIKNNLLALNAKLPEPLSETEIIGTILLTVSKKIQQRN